MDKLEILVVFPHLLWNTKQSPARRHVIWAVERRADVELVISGPGWLNWRDERSAVHNIETVMPWASVVWWYKPLGTRTTPPLVNPREVAETRLAVESYNEAWWSNDQAARDVLENGTRLVICHHANDMPRFRLASERGVAVRHIPHGAEQTVFAAAARPWAERDIDVLLTGIVGQPHYPLRCRWKRLIEQGRLPGRCSVYSRPAYRAANIQQCESLTRDYARQLGRTRIKLGCGSQWRYPLAHYYEAAVAGALVVADTPDEPPDHFPLIANERAPSPVTQQSSDDELIEYVRWWLDHPDELRDAAAEGQRRVFEHHTMDHYAERFVSAVREVLA